MIASDVAARGLDFPMVEHVIHYQVPMNTDVRKNTMSIRVGARPEGRNRDSASYWLDQGLSEHQKGDK